MRNFFGKGWVKAVLILAIVLALFFGTPMGTYAISFFNKTLAGMAQMTYTNELSITDLKVKSLSKVVVTLESNTSTVASRIYSVFLYLDDVKQPVPQEVSWTLAEIPGTKKKVTFDGLDLSAVVVIDAEAIY